MTGYAKFLDNAKTMSFKVNDKKLLKNFIKILEKISNLMNIKFDSKVYYGDNNKYKNTKIKVTEDELCTNFCG